MDKKMSVYGSDPGSDDKGQPDLDSLLVLMRLLVGGTAEGVDELIRRLKERQAAVNQNRPGSMIIFPANDKGLNRLRYALIGLIFEAPDRIARRVSAAHQSTQKAARMIDRLFSPITFSPLLRPVRERHQARRAQVEARLERLIELGRVEEQQGRRLARETVSEVLDEIFAYLARNPELRQVLEQQSVGLTNEAVNRLRQRSAEADRLIDRLAGAVLRRPAGPAGVDIPASPSENQQSRNE